MLSPPPPLFRRIRTAPLSASVKSRDACIYLYRAMRFIGWLPTQRLRWLYLCWTVYTFIFSTGYLPISFLISYIKNISEFSPGEFLTSLQVAINAYGSTMKVIITYTQLWRLAKARELLDRIDERCQSKSERHKIHKAVAKANYAFLIFTFVYTFYAASTFLSAVFSGRPPWQLYNPFVDWHASTWHLWLVSIMEYIVMGCAVLQDQLADTYPVVFIIIIRAHLSILEERIKQLRVIDTLSLEEQHEQLVQCIVDHKLILAYCDMLRPVISGTIFVQFLLIGVVLGLTLINVFFFSDVWSALGSCFFVVTILLQTFPFCYLCNMLVDDCEALTYALFQSNWLDAAPRYKRTLLHFLHNLQQPIIFVAMGVFNISIDSNISVAKFAFSVITIARQMNLAEKFKT